MCWSGPATRARAVLFGPGHSPRNGRAEALPEVPGAARVLVEPDGRARRPLGARAVSDGEAIDHEPVLRPQKLGSLLYVVGVAELSEKKTTCA